MFEVKVITETGIPVERYVPFPSRHAVKPAAEQSIVPSLYDAVAFKENQANKTGFSRKSREA